jgi:3-oxoadipate enol-lactonase
VRSVGLHLGNEWRARAPVTWLERWRPERVALPGGTTELVRMGEGPPLLMLPPIPGYKEAYAAAAFRLARSFSVITFDLRARFEGAPSWGALVDDVGRVADALSLDRFAIVGHSLGGALAQCFALSDPGRVSCLVLSSTFARVRTPRDHWRARFLEQPFALAAQRWLPRAQAVRLASRMAAAGGWVYDPLCDADALELVVECIRRCPPRVGVQYVRLAYAHDTRSRLRDLAPPALILVGERDTSFARAAAEEIASLIGGAEVHRSPGAGHLHPLSNPEWFARTIEPWVSERFRR